MSYSYHVYRSKMAGWIGVVAFCLAIVWAVLVAIVFVGGSVAMFKHYSYERAGLLQTLPRMPSVIVDFVVLRS